MGGKEGEQVKESDDTARVEGDERAEIRVDLVDNEEIDSLVEGEAEWGEADELNDDEFEWIVNGVVFDVEVEFVIIDAVDAFFDAFVDDAAILLGGGDDMITMGLEDDPSFSFDWPAPTFALLGLIEALIALVTGIESFCRILVDLDAEIDEREEKGLSSSNDESIPLNGTDSSSNTGLSHGWRAVVGKEGWEDEEKLNFGEVVDEFSWTLVEVERLFTERELFDGSIREVDEEETSDWREVRDEAPDFGLRFEFRILLDSCDVEAVFLSVFDEFRPRVDGMG